MTSDTLLCLSHVSERKWTRVWGPSTWRLNYLTLEFSLIDSVIEKGRFTPWPPLLWPPLFSYFIPDWDVFSFEVSRYQIPRFRCKGVLSFYREFIQNCVLVVVSRSFTRPELRNCFSPLLDCVDSKEEDNDKRTTHFLTHLVFLWVRGWISRLLVCFNSIYYKIF